MRRNMDDWEVWFKATQASIAVGITLMGTGIVVVAMVAFIKMALEIIRG